MGEVDGIRAPQWPIADAAAPKSAWAADISDARLMRQFMDENSFTEVCACCSRLCTRSSITVMGLQEVPHLELLLRDLPPTVECPRHGFTTYDSGPLQYCLQFAGVQEWPDGGMAQVRFRPHTPCSPPTAGRPKLTAPRPPPHLAPRSRPSLPKKVSPRRQEPFNYLGWYLSRPVQMSPENIPVEALGEICT